MILSILIPTKKSRKKYFDELLATLLPQIEHLEGEIEILAETDDLKSTKDKYGSMLKDAQGKYVWFLKDTFLLSDTAIKDIFFHAEDSPDVMEIKGVTVINRKAHDWQEVSRHSPMLTEFARKTALRKDDIDQRWEILKHEPFIKLIENPIIHRRIELTVVK